MKFAQIDVSWVESRTSKSKKRSGRGIVKVKMRGYLLFETKKRLVIASSIANKQPRGEITSVPKRAITRRIDR